MQHRLHVVLNSLVIVAVVLGLTALTTPVRSNSGPTGDLAAASITSASGGAGARAVDPAQPGGVTNVKTTLKHAASKPLDQPNPLDKARMMERQRLLEAGQTAEAAALAQTGNDRVLVILVEYGGTDVFTWHPGDTWDPLGISDPNEDTGTAGDCSNIITQTQTFTYTGPLHNQIARPISEADRSGQSIWTDDFTPDWFKGFMFGNGVVISYTRQDNSVVHEDFTGQSVKQYFSDLSTGTYTITGDVIGWLPVNHSSWYYGGDACPGARSYGSSSLADGEIPGAGTPRTLVKDALNAVNAISDTLTGFDWANYDINGDGVIDRLWIVHSGYGEEDGTSLLNAAPTDPNDPTRTTPDPAAFYGESAVWSHSSAVTPAYSVTQDIAAGPYIVMPENGGIGVFAHEYAHNLGADDLYAYGNGETSAGFWALQSDDWTGYPIGFEPPAPDPWHLDNWGWLEPFVITDTTQVYTVTVGQASEFSTNTGTDPYRGVKIELPTGLAPLAVPPWQGSYYWWGGKGDEMNSMMTTQSPIVLPNESITLTFDTAYGIETEWDFMWVQVSTNNGTTWNTITNTNTTCTHDSGWIGGNYGFPDDLCGAGLGGFTDYNASFPDPDTETFDLSAYAGQSVLLRFWYMTDWGTTYEGPFVDNVVVTSDSGAIFTDNAEAGGANWTYAENWTRSDGTKPFTQNYYLQWRNTNPNGGYDSALGDSRWRYGPANTGLLVWYNNNAYTDNEIYNYLEDYPSFGPKGRMLVIDSHPDPYRDPNNPFPNAIADVTSRSQMRDAPFTLQPTVDFTFLAANGIVTDTFFAGRPAVSEFNDALGYYPGFEYALRGPSPCANKYWFDSMWDASAVVPAKDYYTTKATGAAYSGQGIRMRGFASPGSLCGSAWYGYWYPPMYDTVNSGNPGDTNSQYGWHVQLIDEGGDHTWGTVRIWNAAVAKEAGSAPEDITTPGDKTLTYTLPRKNTGGSDVFATVAMTVTDGMNIVEVTPAAGLSKPTSPAYTINGNVVTWTDVPILAGESVTFTLVTTVSVQVGDLPTTYNVTYDAADTSGFTNPADHGVWTTQMSLDKFNKSDIGPTTKTGTIGSPVMYQIHLTNTGYNTDTYKVTATTTPSTWPTGIGPGLSAQSYTVEFGPLAPQTSVDVMIYVMVPNGTVPGSKATTTVGVVSTNDPSKTATSSFTTTTLYKVFLPSALK